MQQVIFILTAFSNNKIKAAVLQIFILENKHIYDHVISLAGYCLHSNIVIFGSNMDQPKCWVKNVLSIFDPSIFLECIVYLHTYFWLYIVCSTLEGLWNNQINRYRKLNSKAL